MTILQYRSTTLLAVVLTLAVWAPTIDGRTIAAPAHPQAVTVASPSLILM